MFNVGIVPARLARPPLSTLDCKQGRLLTWELLTEPFAGLAPVPSHAHPQPWLNLPLWLRSSKADHYGADETAPSSPATTAPEPSPELRPPQERPAPLSSRRIPQKGQAAAGARAQAARHSTPTQRRTVPFFSPVNGTKSSLSLCSSACFSKYESRRSLSKGPVAGLVVWSFCRKPAGSKAFCEREGST